MNSRRLRGVTIRRHLSEMQLALVVALAQDWTEAATNRDNRYTMKVGREELPTPTTTTDRAAKSGASPSTQKRADTLAKASPELAKKVAHGEVTMTGATRSKANARKLESHFLSWLFNVTGGNGL